MIRLEEKRGPASIELGQISSSSHEEELDESQQSSLEVSVVICRAKIKMLGLCVPLSGSTLSSKISKNNLQNYSTGIGKTHFTIASSAKTYHPQ